MKKQKEETAGIKLYKPLNLNIENRININNIYFIQQRLSTGKTKLVETKGKHLVKNIPALYYFIHKLIVRGHSDIETFQHPENKKFIRMYARDIQQLKSKSDFNLIFTILRQLNIVEMETNMESNAYRSSIPAYYFKLKHPYYDAQLIQHEILVPKSKALKINCEFGNKNLLEDNESLTALLQSNDVLKHQFQAVSNLNFDCVAATAFINASYKNKAITAGEYNASYINICNLENQRIVFSESNRCKRIYTTVTCFPKIIRPFLHDNQGQSLRELDFSAFNAYAFYKLLTRFNDGSTPMFKKELECYMQFLTNGDFYDNIKEVVFPDANYNRDDVKKKFLKEWLNGKLDGKSKFKLKMDERFPQITAVLNELKKRDYPDFSNTLMRYESQLVNYDIYWNFVKLHPDAAIYTIFDCIMVEQQYADELHLMMLEYGKSFFGVPCKVK